VQFDHRVVLFVPAGSTGNLIASVMSRGCTSALNEIRGNGQIDWGCESVATVVCALCKLSRAL
jgi:hypothetical protein